MYSYHIFLDLCHGIHQSAYGLSVSRRAAARRRGEEPRADNLTVRLRNPREYATDVVTVKSQADDRNYDFPLDAGISQCHWRQSPLAYPRAWPCVVRATCATEACMSLIRRLRRLPYVKREMSELIFFQYPYLVSTNCRS